MKQLKSMVLVMVLTTVLGIAVTALALL